MNTIFLEKEQIYTGNLILVNEKYPMVSAKKKTQTPKMIRKKNTDEMQSLGHDVSIKKEAAYDLLDLWKELANDNQIVPVSGYRSMEEQTQIYEDTLVEKGEVFTQKFVALPGHSEHQSGLAIDLGLKADTIDYICPDFPYEGICGQFRKKAFMYGFIERYPKGKEDITGIAHEPWHFRYVGYPHAKIMTMHELTLEEYVEKLKLHTQENALVMQNEQGEKIEIYYAAVPAKESKIKLELNKNRIYDISGNNIDGFIVTSWEKQHEK